MSGTREGLRTGELMKRICDVLEDRGRLSYNEIMEIDGFSEVPDWKLELVIKKLLHFGDIVETDSNNYQLDS